MPIYVQVKCAVIVQLGHQYTDCTAVQYVCPCGRFNQIWTAVRWRYCVTALLRYCASWARAQHPGLITLFGSALWVMTVQQHGQTRPCNTRYEVTPAKNR